MKRSEIDLTEILNVLEEVRSEDCPRVPQKVIEDICVCEYENQDNRGKAYQETKKIINAYFQATVDN